MNIETRKMARKNHRIISRGVLFCIAPPVPPYSSLRGKARGTLRDSFNEDPRPFLSNHGEERAMGCYVKGIVYKFEGQTLYLPTKMPAVNKRRNSNINTAV
jgi:hypothetical protein